MSRIALDVRRVGGLEEVIRRVGGLEDDVRRVGGLEADQCLGTPRRTDVRRVGGLEGVGGYHSESSAIDEETEAR